MAVIDAPARARTYGNWRRPRSAGLFGLGWLGTGLGLAGLVIVIVTVAVAGVLYAAGVFLALAMVITLLIVRDKHHRTGLQRIAGRLAGWWSRRTGANVYRSGPLAPIGYGSFQLPGLLAPSKLSEWSDQLGRRFALLHVPATGDFSVQFTTSPDGASLVDPEQIDSWVAHWGGWLASLGDEPGVVAAQVVVETAPDTGGQLRREVNRVMDPDAPEVAKAMLREVAAKAPTMSSQVRVWVTLTFAGQLPGGKRRKAEQVAADLATRLPGLTTDLSATGAGAARPVTAQELCEEVLVAYDPDAAVLLERARDNGEDVALAWGEIGPAFTEQQRSHYLHGESAVSVTWGMSQAPRGEVLSNVLAQLIAPHRDVRRKRVAILYRPLDSGRAAAVAESDKRAADFRVSSSTRPTSRAMVEQRAAHQSADEEARGAGLTNFGMLVTATVGAVEELPAAKAAIDNLSATARLQLRVLGGSQDSAFAAGLPVGLALTRHLKVPAEIREGL